MVPTVSTFSYNLPTTNKMAKLAVLVALLALAVVASAQYKKEYGHGHAESYQNYQLHVGHQVPVKVPVYYHEPKYEHKYEAKYEPKYH